VKLIGVGAFALAFVAGSFAQRAATKQQAPSSTAAPSHSSGTPYSITNPGFASSLGNTVAGRGGSGTAHHHYRQPVLAVPYGYPVYVSGYGDYGYGYDNGSAPDQTPAPQVIINQNFAPEHATPVIREYGDDASSDGVRVYDAPGREPVESSAQGDVDYYLIAFKDHTIFSAFAYWVEGDTLHYVTAQRVHNQASLSLVDRDLTAKLNRNSKMQVKLPN
jgi:hypothetical protein